MIVTNDNDIEEEGADLIRKAVKSLPKCKKYNLNFEFIFSDDGEHFNSLLVKNKIQTTK